MPDPKHPSRRHETPPLPGASVPPPERSKPARKSLRCWGGDRSTRPHPPRPPKTESEPRPPAPRTGGWGRELMTYEINTGRVHYHD